MKRLSVGAGLLLALVFGAMAFAPDTFAAGMYRDTGASYVGAGETVEGAAYLVGESVHVEGTVNGDVNCAANTIVITGSVNGDVNCAGTNVTVRGKVTGGVRVAGQNVTLGGEVAGSATAFGTSVTVESAARIGRDAVLGGNDVLMNGAIGRDLVATAQTGTINGPVGRDVEGAYQNLVIGKDAVVGGVLHYTSDKDAVVNGKVNGDVKRDANTQYTGRRADVMQAVFTMAFMALAWMVLIAVALRLVLPKKMHTATNLTPRGALMATGIGLASLLLVPFVAIMLLASVIALPLGLVLILAWVALCLVSGGVTAIYLGRVIFGKQKIHPIAATTLAALGLGVLFMIPGINVLAFVGSLAFGTGAVMYAFRGEHEVTPKGGPKVKLTKA